MDQERGRLRVINIAHRGARSLAPENTLVAAAKAQEVGADLWETDIGVSADGQLILFHDDSLARTTDAQKRFPDRAPWYFTAFTLAELRTLDAGSWFVNADPFGEIAAGQVSLAEQEAYHGEPIPSLREALIFTRERDYRVNVELKQLPAPLQSFPLVERVLTLIDELGLTDQIVISSFVHEWLRELHARRPQIKIQALIGYSEQEPLDWGKLEFKSYNARSTLIDERQIRAVSQQGIAVNLFVVNEESQMRRFSAAGAAGLITDYPQRLAALLHEGVKR
ncbi:MAG TPA: glycerophosphodiester phosphodiesterase [Candidatus Fraserbacteria bacterium]|nr:glycerophosphodiester phosphodiesterase [Candidatus Fraserbacteria bacterium]